MEIVEKRKKKKSTVALTGKRRRFGFPGIILFSSIQNGVVFSDQTDAVSAPYLRPHPASRQTLFPSYWLSPILETMSLWGRNAVITLNSVPISPLFLKFVP